MTLSAVSLAYYRHIMPYGLAKFKRFATNVWCISAEGKSNEQLATAGICALEDWMNKLGLVMNIRDLGVTESMFNGIIKGTFIMKGGYKILSKEDILSILQDSM
jgi:alcohol dehydrogenase YqhD (iron-dependent ADH family)